MPFLIWLTVNGISLASSSSPLIEQSKNKVEEICDKLGDGSRSDEFNAVVGRDDDEFETKVSKTVGLCWRMS